ncbi:uncharacterized protein EDB93DRAFT_1145345, partial [Suillus bovinus]|uniref:uncharacterized protein n=1 Tax=Suillus bovinus TaxID=48563 RepID=UPI001B880A1E
MCFSFLAIIVALATSIVSVSACQNEFDGCVTTNDCCAGLSCGMDNEEMGGPHSHNHGLWDQTGLDTDIAVVPSTFESRLKSQAAFR